MQYPEQESDTSLQSITSGLDHPKVISSCKDTALNEISSK
jgi:hypothetical protein